PLRITPSVAEQEGQQTETEATGAPQKHHYTLNQQVGSITIVDNQDMSISIWILGDPSVALSEIDRLILDSAVNKGPFIALPAGYVPSRYDINPIDQVNSELWWAIQNGYMTVKAAGVRVREIETVSDGYQFFGFDIENDYIAGFDRGSWGERF
nr:hypothetical protein [Klebsiella pneumoniae]MCF0509663.1 hypothetical protein [Klebsiella pneumoniae]MCF0531603.1 hypothetical protein [Klebsiella pneumoniae]